VGYDLQYTNLRRKLSIESIQYSRIWVILRSFIERIPLESEYKETIIIMRLRLIQTFHFVACPYPGPSKKPRESSQWFGHLMLGGASYLLQNLGYEVQSPSVLLVFLLSVQVIEKNELFLGYNSYFASLVSKRH